MGLHAFSHLIVTTSYEGVTVILPILQRRNLRPELSNCLEILLLVLGCIRASWRPERSHDYVPWDQPGGILT